MMITYKLGELFVEIMSSECQSNAIIERFYPQYLQHLNVPPDLKCSRSLNERCRDEYYSW